MNKKKCLLLVSRIPFPPIGGDRLKSYNMIKVLSERYSIQLIIITDERMSSDARDFITRNCDSYKIFVRSRMRFAINVLAALFFTSTPLQVRYYYFPEVKQKLNLMFSSVDFAIVNLVRLVPYVEGFSKPIFLDIVDSIGLNYLSSRKKVSSWFWKLIYRIEIKRLLTYEKECVKSLRNTFFVNYDECKYYSKFGSTRWIPNGVNNALFSYVYKEDQYMNSVAFFGKMDYQPNIDAVLWFVNHVLGELPEMSFYIIGSNPVEKVLSLQSKFANIHVTGYLDDPYRVLNSCALVVSPMQTGGGIQNKILESMALGKVNLLTTKAASPIQGAIEGIHYLLADTPELMKAHITQVMNDRAGYEHIGENAKKLMMELYTWENYKTKLYSMLEENYI